MVEETYTLNFAKNFSEEEVSHVVGVLKVIYLFSCAGGQLSQHCGVVATANIYKSR